MKLGTIGRTEDPFILFADEPHVARAIAAHTVYGGPVTLSLHLTRHEEHGSAVVFECQLGDGEPFTRYFTLKGNEFVVDAMIGQRRLVLLSSTPDVPGSKVEGLPVELDDNAVATLRQLRRSLD
jgi:hypothetical protein